MAHVMCDSIEVYTLLRFLGPLACHHSMKKVCERCSVHTSPALGSPPPLCLQAIAITSNYHLEKRPRNMFCLSSAIHNNSFAVPAPAEEEDEGEGGSLVE